MCVLKCTVLVNTERGEVSVGITLPIMKKIDFPELVITCRYREKKEDVLQLSV